MTNPDEVKDKFYDDLDSVISAAPRRDKLILPGDLNARVGTDHQTWEGVIGSEGVWKCNSNGLLLLRKWAEHELLITNTVFRLSTRRKTSWIHPRSKHWHLIYYVIGRRKDRQDVRVTKTMCGVDCWTDHRFVVSKLNLRIQPVRRPQGKKVPKILNVSKLKQNSKRQAFVNDLCSRLDALEHSSEDVDESWTVFRDTVYSSAMDSLGPVSRKHEDWFDENDKKKKKKKKIQGLLEEKHQKHEAYLRNTSSVSSKNAYSKMCKTVQTRISKKTDEIQSFADRKNMKKFFDALKTIYGPQSSGTTPLLSADGNSLLTDKEAILKRWAEHLNGVHNRLSSMNDEAINRLPQVEYNPLLDELPTVSETVKAIKLLSYGRLQDQMQYLQKSTKQEVLQLQRNWRLFQSYLMWRKEATPREGLWKIMAKFGCQIHISGAAVPWWYACKGPKRWWVFWFIPCDEWS